MTVASEPGETQALPDDRRDSAEDLLARLVEAAACTPGLEVLVLHGSRARRDAHPLSDWDLGYIADDRFDPETLRADLISRLGTDRIDLVDLEHTTGLLRYRAARDGIVMHESTAGRFERFWKAAVTFWCDAEPQLRRGSEAVLAGLGG
jgi:Polymerase beta, Nucleotidyltransferase